MKKYLKQEFAKTYKKESLIKDVYRKLCVFEDFEKEKGKDLSEINNTELLSWYIKNATKFSYNSIKPIKSYITKYKQWIQSNSNLNKDIKVDTAEYDKGVITKAVINKYKKALIKNLDELEERLLKAFPLEEQEELSVNINMHLIYSLTFLGLTFDEICDLTIDDIKTNYLKAIVEKSNKKVEITNLLLINLLIKCMNVRELKYSIKKKNSKVVVKNEKLDNNYLINFKLESLRNSKSIKKTFYAKLSDNLDKELYLTDIEKFGIIKKLKDYELENNLTEITDINDTKAFTKLYQSVYPFKSPADRKRFLITKLRDYFCVYLAW